MAEQVYDLSSVQEGQSAEGDPKRDCREPPRQPRRRGPPGAGFAGIKWCQTLHDGRTRGPQIA
jgi:hypothetical protein